MKILFKIETIIIVLIIYSLLYAQGEIGRHAESRNHC